MASSLVSFNEVFDFIKNSEYIDFADKLNGLVISLLLEGYELSASHEPEKRRFTLVMTCVNEKIACKMYIMIDYIRNLIPAHYIISVDYWVRRDGYATIANDPYRRPWPRNEEIIDNLIDVVAQF